MRRVVVVSVAFVVLLGVAYVSIGAEGQGLRKGHVIPVEKGLSKELIGSLYARGERAVWRGKELETIAMPVGGIAAGQLYLRGDGTLGGWYIFNKHVFTGYGAQCYRHYRPDSAVGSGFAVVVAGGEGVTVKALDASFGQVEFLGEYPIGVVRYKQEGLPIEVQMEAFSPFIPLNAEDSGLPATVFCITVKNVSEKAVEAGVVGWLENAVLIDSSKAVVAVRRTEIKDEKGRTLIIHTAERAPKRAAGQPSRPKIVLADFEGADYGKWKVTGQAFGTGPAHGTLPNQQKVSGFLGKGLVNSYLGGDGPQGTLTSPVFEINRKFINFLIGGGNHKGQTCVNLLVDGQVVRTAVGKNNEKLEWHFWSVQEFEGKEAQIQIVDRASGGWGHINVDQIELSDEPKTAPLGPLEKLPDYGSMVLAADELTNPPGQVRKVLDAVGSRFGELSAETEMVYPALKRRSAALVSRPVELEAGQRHTFVFVLTWFFPNHPHGRYYAKRFDDAAEVAHYVLDHFTELAGQTRLWHKTFYEDSTLPRWLLFRLHSTVCNLATETCQWWANGRFWAWEGVGCCAGTCTHVWNYAHAAARLFPQLERSVREMQDFGEGFHPDSGLVGFRSNHAYAADGQCGTVLKAYREHLCSADMGFLRRNWWKIKKALEYSIAQDGNADGLIENSQHNTFDINFEGANTFVGSLYLAALRAGEEMAKEMGDMEFAKRCRKIFESGRRLTIERLWNGEYFIQDVDLSKHPKYQYGQGCLSDQLFGQGWAHQLGLGYIYPQQYVKRALKSVWRYNWAPDVGPYNKIHKPERWFARPGEPGLFTCTWPKSPYLAEGVRYRNEVWTGIEYQVAGHMIWEGMVTEGLAICYGIHQRYHPAKHNPFNEVECGDHYARALASWGVYTALSGFEYHGPKGHIGFSPRVSAEQFRAAFTAAEGWGLFEQIRIGGVQQERIALRWGRLGVRSLAFEVPRHWSSVDVSVRAAGRPVRVEYSLKDGRVEISLRRKLIFFENQDLLVRIERRSRGGGNPLDLQRVR